MEPPKLYSIESYEPTVLRPEEMKQNNIYLRAAFTEKKLNRFNLNIPSPPSSPPRYMKYNPQIINNNILMNHFNMMNMNNITKNQNIKKIPLNSHTTTIPNSLIMKNPFINNNKNNNKVLHTIQYNNQFVNPKLNQIKYIVNPMPSKNAIVYQRLPQKIPPPNLRNNPTHIYRSKSSQYYHNYTPFQTIHQPNNYYRNNNNPPVYRRIVYRKKN